MQLGAILDHVAARCAALACEPSLRSARDLLDDIAVHATEPLRVAVTGDVSTGKSTLVNALLGQDVAKVQREETTAEVTWFRGPCIPPPPPLSPAHRCRSLAFPLASELTLVDTPGVNTVSGHQVETEAMLAASTVAAGSVTVLIYLCLGNVSDGMLRRIQAFSAATSGPFDEGAGIIACGSKADDIVGDTPGDRARLAAHLRRQAGRFCGHAVAVSPILAMSARTGKVDRRLIRQLELIARTPAFYAALDRGWEGLRGKLAAAGPQPGVDVDYLYQLSNTTLGVREAAALIRSGTSDPEADIGQLWLRMSGLADLETLLRRLAADRDVLTISAVTGRLRRLAVRLGRDRGAPIRAVCAELNRHPAMAGYERRAAAILLESDSESLRRIPVPERKAAADMLRGTRAALPAGSVEQWRRRAVQPGQPAIAQRIAWIVVEASRQAAPAKENADAQ
jgi:50S ribosome-binding GTPase